VPFGKTKEPGPLSRNPGPTGTVDIAVAVVWAPLRADS